MDEQRPVRWTKDDGGWPGRGRRRRRGAGAARLVTAVLAATTAVLAFAAWRQMRAEGLAPLVQQVAGAVGGATGTVLRTPPLSPAAVAARVDPAVVDINVTLAFGQGTASGTGMILTSSGEVLTNNHVVQGASVIRVTVAGRPRPYVARVLGVDPTADVALLQLEGASGLPTVTLGNSDAVSVGQPVVAIGNALGLGGTPSVTQGTITAKNQSIFAQDATGGGEELHGLLETSAALQPGDSGGPLVNLAGQVIGMDTAAAGPAYGHSYRRWYVAQAPSAAGFAIPINTAVRIAREIAQGRTGDGIVRGSPAFLGVEVTDVQELRPLEQAQLGTDSGAVVVGVAPGSPAAAAGLTPGDVITGLGGQSVADAASLQQLIRAHQPGASVSVSWVTPGGQAETAVVRLAAGPVP
ncbi:MAG: S1C family serine protease [Actinomycetia bacterium]|nr:S1C family serine protease [Actinomycetes bacterium]